MLLTQPNKFTVATRTIKNNHLFLVDTTYGSISQDNDAGLGLYHLDTRFLSCYEIKMNGTNPVCLLSSTEAGYLSSLVYTNGQMKSCNERDEPCTVLEETIQLKRESILDGALFEKLTLSSYNIEAVQIKVSLCFDADFRDMFEIRHLVPYKDRPMEKPRIVDNMLIFSYRGSVQSYETRIIFKDFEPQFVGENTVVYETLLFPLEKREINLEIQTLVFVEEHQDVIAMDYEAALASVVSCNQAWQEEVTIITSDNEDFNEMVDRSQKDLRMLLTQSDDGLPFLSAGIPWYVCLFGRDSIITARECLIFNATLAKSTLKILARYQGKEDNPSRDEEPGKILHELRKGELAYLKEIPHTPYYGSVDATPLWIVLLYDYFLWTRDCETLQALWPNALAAMDWIDRHLACSPIGYLTYLCQAKGGIQHQGWKDSHNSAMYENGLQAEPPIALSEVQGYVYLAKRRMAALAEIIGDKDLKAKLRRECQAFKKHFNRDFWIPDQGYCALGLDNQGRQLRVIASNPGHCLETGIFTTPHARQVASRLMTSDMFSGWGIRTLSSKMLAYNPMSYHNGSVWPHDNAMIAQGFSVVGRPDFAEKIFTGLFEASRTMAYKRLPELFCGFSRDVGKSDPPVRYPVACSPQAWAAAAVFSLVQSMLNLAPDLQDDNLKIKQPKLPHFINVLHIRNLRVGQTVLDLEFRRTETNVMVDVRDRRGTLDVLLKI